MTVTSGPLNRRNHKLSQS